MHGHLVYTQLMEVERRAKAESVVPGQPLTGANKPAGHQRLGRVG